MGLFKCRCCGADLNVKSGDRIVTCDYCGSAQTVPSSDDASVLSVYARGNLLRNQGEFDRAYATLSKLLGGGSEDAELYWNLLLCKYGVTYVDDYGGSKKPTVNRMSVSSILDDEDYRKVMSLADVVSRGNYEEEARRISRIQEEILSIAQKEKPYDVFVSYKETDELGGRTEDSVLAQEIYDGLTEKGYRVFLSRVTLSSVVGHEYEPYIYSALYSSKALILAACDAERVNSAWVRNEWQRYLFMMEGDKGKVLIPCYRGVDPYDFPKELRRLQGIDASKLGWMQDLLIGLKKVIKADKQAESGKPSTAPAGLDSIADQMVERGFSLLKSGKSGQASKMFEDALGYADKAMAYIGLLCVDLGATSAEEIDEDVSNDSNYEKALDAATPEEKEGIRSIVTRYVDKQNAIKQSAYDKAMKAKESGDYDEAIVGFEGLQSFKDSAEQAEECKNLADEKTYNDAVEFMNVGDYNRAYQLFDKLGSYMDSKSKADECSSMERRQSEYEKAVKYMNDGDYFHAVMYFGSILDFKDAKALYDECSRIQEDARKEALYKSCLLADDVNLFTSSARYRINKAIQILSTIHGYKDSDQLIVKYEGMLKDLEDKMATKREEPERAKAKKVKRAEKVSLIAGASALFLTGVLLFVFLYAVPKGRQNNIEKFTDPVISDDGKTLTYGLYPQTHVSGANTIASLNKLRSAESNGWYLLDGTYYAKKSATPYGSSYKFDDGTTIVSGTTYWFRCEPIEWKILSSGNGAYSVVSSVLLDAHRYDDSSNSYKDSEIREWLNGTFYDTAFALGNDRIKTTEVDNSASTTGSSSNPYACANTEDNVYLLSYKDYTNMAYFTNSAARQCKTTDWARANHAYCSTSSSYLYNGWYWTRSPRSNDSGYAWNVGRGGDLFNYYVAYSYGGVRPALSLSIS